MNDKIARIAFGVLCATYAYDYGVHLKNKKTINRLKTRNKDLAEALSARNKQLHLTKLQVDFLVNLCNENHVALDEFDLIALNDLNFKVYTRKEP